MMPNDFTHANEPIVLTPVLLHLLPFIPYPDFQAATGHLEMTAQFHKMCRVIGHPGAGKTRLLLEFARAHDNAHYICPARPCRIKDLLRLLGEPMGYYVPGTTSQQVIRDLIHSLNHRGCDALCPKGGRINNIDRSLAEYRSHSASIGAIIALT